MMAYTCNPSLQNAEAGKSEASLVYMLHGRQGNTVRSCLKTSKIKCLSHFTKYLFNSL